jgi:hypothetical protein
MRAKRNYVFGTILTVAVAAGLWAAQGSEHQKMLNWPYSKVEQMMSNPQSAGKTVAMARANNVMLMGGMPMGGTAVTMKGELTGADCYLSSGEHGPQHALCAKVCVLHGGPIVFVGANGTTYLVLPPKDGVHFPEAVLDDLGKPGVTVNAHEIDSHGIKALSVDSVQG